MVRAEVCGMAVLLSSLALARVAGAGEICQAVASVTVTNGGGGYVSAPTVSFSGGGGAVRPERQ